MQLPDDDHNFSRRLGRIKKGFTDRWLEAGGRETLVSTSRREHRERGIWQKRFWDHLIRDERDMIRHLEYIHYNSVKHGHACCPHAWPWSSFHDWVRRGIIEEDWGCCCDGRMAQPMKFDDLDETAME